MADYERWLISVDSYVIKRIRSEVIKTMRSGGQSNISSHNLLGQRLTWIRRFLLYFGDIFVLVLLK